MPFPTEHFDAETLALMRKAFDAAWEESPQGHRPDSGRNLDVCEDYGRSPRERDPDRLMELALEAVAKAY